MTTVTKISYNTLHCTGSRKNQAFLDIDLPFSLNTRIILMSRKAPCQCFATLSIKSLWEIICISNKLMCSHLSGVALLRLPDPGPGELGGGRHGGHGEAHEGVQPGEDGHHHYHHIILIPGETGPQTGQGLGVAAADAHHLRHDALLLIFVSKNRVEIHRRNHLQSSN